MDALQQASYPRKSTGRQKIGVMKFLGLTLYLLAGVTLNLISASAIINRFKKYDFREFNLVI